MPELPEAEAIKRVIEPQSGKDLCIKIPLCSTANKYFSVVLTAAAVLADRKSRKVLVPLLCVHLLSLAGSFFILFSCGYYHNLGKFVLFCLVIGQISGTFFSLTDIFPRKKIYYILYAGLVCLIFLKTIFLQIVDV